MALAEHAAYVFHPVATRLKQKMPTTGTFVRLCLWNSVTLERVVRVALSTLSED